jgi:uncharacterized protein (DUF2141 family)
MQHRYTLGLVIGLFSLIINTASAATVFVTVKNVASTNGMVVGALCDKENFLKNCALKATEKITSDAVVLTFKDVPPGKYAVNAYHDENNSKTLDRSILGIPQEGYAFSRNARGHRGPPSFEDAAFDVKEGKNELSVTLNY